ncbi:spore germination protein [Paenibacillus sp. P26]|nr:spore germination protein [Paenibacillus sp. P26]
MGFFKVLQKIRKSSRPDPNPPATPFGTDAALRPSLRENLQKVRETLGNSTDLIIREVAVGEGGTLRAAVLYTDGLTDVKSVDRFILEALMADGVLTLAEQTGTLPGALQKLKDRALTVSEIRDVADFNTLFTQLLSGDAVILLDGYAQGFTVAMGQWEERGVTEPTSQTVVRGPREGFSENIRTNTALIRRKIKDPHLWLETRVIGTVSKTDVAIMYIKGIANDKVVEEVRRRLNRIVIDGILESGYIEELIQDSSYSPFPTVFHTERPDVIAAGLMEGRVAILVDGTPFVLLVPSLFIHFFQVSEDYAQRADIAVLIRLLRILSLGIALLGPSLYIAITTFHQEMIPTGLLISLAAQREGVPFPAFVEAFIMEVAFEILREAGVRLPRTVGQAVSIVGALVIGEAAVRAGIVSASMVIVVSITAIANFVFPAFNMAISIRMLRFPMMLLVASFGLYGITVGLIALVLHLCSLRSFGIPYMAPFGPFIMADQKDAVFRVPWWGMFARPRLINQNNTQREQNPPTSDLKPDPRGS